MKKQLFSILTALVLLMQAIAPCIAEENTAAEGVESAVVQEEVPYGDEEKLYREALSDLDYSKPELSEVQKLYSQKKYEEAIEAYKVIFFDKLEKIAKTELLPKPVDRHLFRAEGLMKDQFNRGNDSGQNEQVNMGEAGKWNWFPETCKPGDAWVIYGHRMEYMVYLAAEFVDRGGDMQFLRKWLDIYEDFDVNFEKQAEKIGTRWNNQAISHYKTGPLETLGRGLYRLRSMLEVERNYPGVLEKEYTNREFAAMLIQQARDIYNTSTAKSVSPNIIIHGITHIINCYPLWNDSKKVQERYSKIGKDFKDYLSWNYCYDGGDAEHSFHYNKDFIGNVMGIKTAFQTAIGEVPDWFSECDLMMRNRLRMLTAVTTPDGSYPTLAEDYPDTSWAASTLRVNLPHVENDKTSSQIINYFDKKTDVKPAFTSIAFPYVGYYIMREDWAPDSQYIFLKGNRRGGGHYEFNSLDVQYQAYGERLLWGSPATYSELAEFSKYRMYHKSDVANNTVLVDGYSQARDETALSDFSTPQDGVWYTSDFADVASSEFSDGYNLFQYYNARKDRDVPDVVHNRTVLMDKENVLGLVIDSFNTSREHDYTMCWNFDKKFNTYSSITANSEEKWMKTTLNDGGAGLEMYSIYDGDVNYKTWCGEIYENASQPRQALGWWLGTYGTDFKPAVHTETYFSGSGSRRIVTLLNPTNDGKSKLKNLERGANSFKAEIDNDSVVEFAMTGTNKKERLKVGEVEGFADYIYTVKYPDGCIRGIAANVGEIYYKGEKCDTQGERYFDFEIQNGQFRVISKITAPTTFEWVDNGGSTDVPYYGFDKIEKFNYR